MVLKVKVKRPYLTRVTRDTCALYPLSSVSAPFYGYLKLKLHRSEESRIRRWSHRGSIREPIQLRRPRTNQLSYACSYEYSILKLRHFAYQKTSIFSIIYYFLIYCIIHSVTLEHILHYFQTSKPIKFERYRRIPHCTCTIHMSIRQGRSRRKWSEISAASFGIELTLIYGY